MRKEKATPSFPRFLKLLVIYGLSLYVFAFFLLVTFQNKLLYYPSQIPFKECPYPAIKKSELLRYYHIPSAKEAKRTLVFFHGNASRACQRGQYLITNLQIPDIDIVLLEYPGFAGDNQSPSQKLILKAVDEWISDYKTQQETASKTKKLFFLGESLGSAVATYASSQIDNDGLILFSPFTSITALAKYHYPFFPLLNSFLQDPYPAYQWAQESKSKAILSFHGDKDDIIPTTFSIEQMGNFEGSVQWSNYPEKSHNDLSLLNDELWQKINNFILSSKP